MDTIYLLPGIGGTPLRWRTGAIGDLDVWAGTLVEQAVITVALNQLSKTRLDEHGISEHEIVISPHPYLTYYAEIIDRLTRAGYNVVWKGYDWRLRPSLASQAIQITEPGWLLGHSMGVLVAAHIYARLKAGGNEGLVKGIITCGTPWQEFEAPSAFETCFGRGSVFFWLAVLGFGYHILSNLRRILFLTAPRSTTAELLETFLTWDGLSTLIPNAPPQCRVRASYSASEGYDSLRQSWLNRGMEEKTACLAAAQALPAGLLAEIVGTGVLTVPAVTVPPDYYGDGVTHNDARLHRWPTFSLNGAEHAELMSVPVLPIILKLLIDQDFPRAVQLDMGPLRRNGVTWAPGPYVRPVMASDSADDVIARQNPGTLGGMGIDP